ncbi:hypothetical protein [Cupriavidus oxalaticus]|nr:hypothetical protein [Cupriavidus oxalaticus]QRQ86263.1 hypothetical protein JTE91_23940 [Cupriavidus oxalaticus]QRQ95410.1 hypothetical protein JTE92_18320 [Cupriavidus oxalaticus]WQD84067.1 hypothetical protein U0036_06030 [Cupriavidus oxalaticus]
MLKKVLLLTVAGAALGAGAASAGTMGARDPYTDGAKAGKYDVYADGARVTHRRDVYTDGARATGGRDVFTDGARVTNRDGFVEDDKK